MNECKACCTCKYWKIGKEWCKKCKIPVKPLCRACHRYKANKF